MTNFNERTNTLLYKNISLTLYSRKGWGWLCARDELETETDCYFDPKFFFNHSSTSFSSWMGCSTVGHWEPKALCLPLALNSAAGYIIVSHPPTSAVLPLIYTGAPLYWRLGRGSIHNIKKGTNPTIFSPAKGKCLGRMSCLTLVWQPVQLMEYS